MVPELGMEAPTWLSFAMVMAGAPCRGFPAPEAGHCTEGAPWGRSGEIFFCVEQLQSWLGVGTCLLGGSVGIQQCSLPLGQVSPEKCRFAIGRILSEGDAKPTEEQIRQFQKYGFKIFSFPTPSHVVMASFPFTTPLSIHLAVNRVHPALDTYIKVSGVWGTPRSCQHPASS